MNGPIPVAVEEVATHRGTSGRAVRASAGAALVALVLCAGPALPADDIPFTRSGSPISDQSLVQPTLSDLMSLVQLRHVKVWFAGAAENWELLSYETDKIGEALFRSAMLYTNIPVELVSATSGPVTRMREAAKRKDRPAFRAAYGDLNAACNACHTTAGVPFIRIQTPTSFPLSDQALGQH